MADGVDPKTRLLLRPMREQMEQVAMLGEVVNYGRVFDIEYDTRSYINTGRGASGLNAPSWQQLLTKRVLAKEAAIVGVDPKVLLETRPQRMEEEDTLMLKEMELYGNVLSMQSYGNNSIVPSNIFANDFNFDVKNTNIRPTGWAEIRKKRIIEKELAAVVDKNSIMKLRPIRERAVSG